MTPLLTRLRLIHRREEGFTMIAAIMILFVTSLLVTVTLVSAGGDIALTHNSTNQKKAYYAAMAGLSAYKYNLNTSSKSTYWTTCPSIKETEVTKTPDEHYSVVTLPSEGHSQKECEEGKQAAIIEGNGSAIGTFRIEATGTAGTGSEKATRKLVATFSHPGFLNYVYLTNYEVLDPAARDPEPVHCEHYYKERVANGWTGECGTIEFAPEDKVNGPLHTNDAAAICSGSSKPTFGRSGHHDKIEMNGGHYAACGSGEWNMLGEFTESGPTLTPPETDTELLEAADYKWHGRTEIELKATNPNTMAVTTEGSTTTKYFPANGVIYVENEGSCSVKYSPYGTDVDYETDTNCGNVYVHGAYTEPLTIAAQNDVIINGEITTKTEGSEGKPIGTGRLGLIATNFVRVYHPVAKEYKVAESTAETTTPKITYKEETPKTREKTVEEKNPTITEETIEQEPERHHGSESCPNGFRLENRKCIEKVSVEKCPNGYTLKNKKCDKQVTEEYCNTGYTLTNKKCVANTGEESCSYGYTLNSKKQCVASCPYGETYEEATGLCVGKCNSGDTSLGKGACEYKNSSSGCDAENESASEDPRKWGSLDNPTIDAAILSTSHSFIVDNFDCGAQLGALNVWGAIAQFWRGPVGTSGYPGTGYLKNYNYDERLKYLQPPDFLTPSSSQLKLDRITAASS
jgi:hypothetical protein